jgi:hypothetical protein
MEEVPMVQTAIDKKMPNLIPVDDGDDKLSDDKENKKMLFSMSQYQSTTQEHKQGNKKSSTAMSPEKQSYQLLRCHLNVSTQQN